MSEHFVAGVTLSTIDCYKCHCVFAIPREMNDRLLKTHDTFYCPAGHAQHYLGLTPEQKLQRELDEKQRQLEREEASWPATASGLLYDLTPPTWTPTRPHADHPPPLGPLALPV
jgi:hypothetical protein